MKRKQKQRRRGEKLKNCEDGFIVNAGVQKMILFSYALLGETCYILHGNINQY